MKICVIFALCFVWCGCTEQVYWSVRNEPTTEAERVAVAEQVKKIMAATPRTMSGHDQDWDDAIAAATRSAKETLCRPTLWEHLSYQRWTGKWRYLDDGKP